MNKKSLILIVLFFVNLIVSCVEDPFFNDCGDIKAYFEINGLQSSNRAYTSDVLNLNREIDSIPVNSFDRFFVKCFLDHNLIASTEEVSYGYQLMALSCIDPGDRGDKIGLDSIAITTKYDFNEEYRAGSVINDVVKVETLSRYEEKMRDSSDIETYLLDNKEGVDYPYFNILFDQSIPTTDSLALDIYFKLNNGSVFSSTSPVVYISH